MAKSALVSCAALTLLGCSVASDFDYSFRARDGAGSPPDLDAGSGTDAAQPLVDGASSEPSVEGGSDGALCALTETSERTCEGGGDEDCDGDADCADADCRQSAICCPAPSFESGDQACDDQRDNDCDGLSDCDDSGCSGVYACTCSSEQPEGWSVSQASCVNGNDDDCDRLTDCKDPDCTPAPQCCEKSAEQELGAACTDGRNNDCDSDGADCADPDCRAGSGGGSASESGLGCENRLDDDCDGLADCADSDCRAALVCCMRSAGQELGESACDDGLNNDCDAQGADCMDADCALSPACCRAVPENTQKLCANGKDDDCDGLSDCEDTSCRSSYECCVRHLNEQGQKLVPSEAGYCSDRYDNDCDGTLNCKDSDCSGVSCGLIVDTR